MRNSLPARGRRTYRSRLRGRDRGSVLATTAISIAFSALILMLIGSALSQTLKTRSSKEFTLAGQQSDNAMANAIDQLNNTTSALPTAGTPATSSGDTPGTGGWKWWTVPATGQAGLTGAIDAQGTFGKTRRTTVANLYSMLMSSATVNGAVDYQIAPSGAFTHAIFGNNIQIVPGTNSGSTPSTPASTVTGIVGAAGGAVAFSNGAGATGGLTFYGAGNGSLTPSSMASTTSPMPLNMDTNALNALYAAQCGGSAPTWKSSAQPLVSGINTVSTSNTLICASSVVIDVPLKVTGPGVLNILMPATGTDSVNADVTADSNASLALYGGSSTNFGGATTRTVANTYIFSPAGTCATGTAGVQVSITGSVACQTVRLTGKAVWRAVDSSGSTMLTLDPRLSTKQIWWTTSSVNSGISVPTGS